MGNTPLFLHPLIDFFFSTSLFSELINSIIPINSTNSQSITMPLQAQKKTENLLRFINSILLIFSINMQFSRR